MLKEELFETIEKSNINEADKKIITSLISNTWDVAYQTGFQEGMKRSAQIQNATFDMIMGKNSFSPILNGMSGHVKAGE